MKQSEDQDLFLDRLARVAAGRRAVPITVDAVRQSEAEEADVRFEGVVPKLRKARKASVGMRSIWTNVSVQALKAADPVEEITRRARTTVLDAIEAGWQGPPYDPAQLAERLGIALEPNQDVLEARTISRDDRFVIEFNPFRPQARLRFSIAHEIAHTLFPDCAFEVRNRVSSHQMKGDDWQLEMLCNVAASEILMPVGTMTAAEGDSYSVSVERVLTLRRKFLVSAEAVLLRLMKLTREHCFAFAAHLDKNNRYRVDYVMQSASVGTALPICTGDYLPVGTKAAECTAIGFTEKESGLFQSEGDWETEYVGVAPYPGQTTPRVLGISKPRDQDSSGQPLVIVRGDATQPRGAGHKIICQVVNDKATSWGSGFAGALRRKWPDAQRQFTGWASSSLNLTLGNVHFAEVGEHTIIASLIAQHGYGHSAKPRIRYGALYKSLRLVSAKARANGESVHMPRIGSGQAGGDWNIIQESIEQALVSNGLAVTIYDLPNAVRPTQQQAGLFDVRTEQDQFI